MDRVDVARVARAGPALVRNVPIRSQGLREVTSMARHRRGRSAAWQGCQLREARRALEERRQRLREAAQVLGPASLKSPERM